ncbi:MAG: hypothetical protein COV02_00045, partial [Candidatus Terrybacteria bacterium CG10_big_fil_rev_8_21_14_0_10_41_10]
AHDSLIKKGLAKKARLILQIHDELIFEIDDSVTAQASDVIKGEMENALGDKSKGIPILVDVKAGGNWGQMDKLK